ncbi:EGLN3 [Scenedesmus sp. PABB004]|nr:EGLN3 [Scenedesmus sp. PABB004]
MMRAALRRGGAAPPPGLLLLAHAAAPGAASPAAAAAAAAAATQQHHHQQHQHQPPQQQQWRRQHTQRLPLERLQAALTPSVCEALAARGHTVVDGVLGAPAAAALEAELRGLHARGLMHANHTHLVDARGGTSLLAKAAIMEAELSLDAAVRRAAPLLAQLDGDRTLATMLSLLLPALRLESHAIKLQHNEGGGGCFPMHFDSDDGLDGRRVTAILYLNANWRPEHGGQLRLYPFPAPPLDVEPLADRLVLFSSTRMLHRVLPSAAPRSCLTVWLSEGRARGGAAAAGGAARVPPPRGDAAGRLSDELLAFLMQPTVRQHVCKLAHAEEWERSIRESHPANEHTEAALARHREELGVVRRALAGQQPGLGQLLDAAALAARAAGGGGGGGVGERELEAAYALLRRAAAHVAWF